MVRQGGSYIVENGKRRRVVEPPKRHPDGDGARPAPSEPDAKPDERDDRRAGAKKE